MLCTCLEDGEILSIQSHVSYLCDRKESDIIHLFVLSISGQSTTTLVSLLWPFIPAILDILPQGLSVALMQLNGTWLNQNLYASELKSLLVV
jgi:hypothetical protein